MPVPCASPTRRSRAVASQDHPGLGLRHGRREHIWSTSGRRAGRARTSSAHWFVEPVHGCVFGDGSAHLIAPRGMGRHLAEQCNGRLEGVDTFGSAVVRAEQPPVLGAAVPEVDELIRFEAIDKHEGLDALGFHSGEMAGEVFVGSPVEVLPETIAADAVRTMA